jgi:hypothetical protein
MHQMAQTLTPKEIALQWETDARTVRKFLRSPNGTGKVGQGNRHAIETKSVKSLKKAFDAWLAAKAAKATETAEPDADEAIEAEVTEVTETE